MIGLPGEGWADIIKTCKQVIYLEPDFVRFYPALVISDTQLAILMQNGCDEPLSLSEAVKRTVYYRLL